MKITILIMINLIMISSFSFSIGGLELPLTTDGNPNFEKIIDKVWAFPDTPDSFQITKEGNGYSITHFSFDEETESETEQTTKINIYKDIYLHDGTYYYAYDTKFKSAVIIDPSDLKIIFPADMITD